MINNRYYSAFMWGRGLGVSLVNTKTEERRDLVTSSSIVWEVGSPQRGIYNGIKTYCISQGCIGAKNLDGDTNDATKHMVLHPCANERHKQV